MSDSSSISTDESSSSDNEYSEERKKLKQISKMLKNKFQFISNVISIISDGSISDISESLHDHWERLIESKLNTIHCAIYDLRLLLIHFGDTTQNFLFKDDLAESILDLHITYRRVYFFVNAKEIDKEEMKRLLLLLDNHLKTIGLKTKHFYEKDSFEDIMFGFIPNEDEVDVAKALLKRVYGISSCNKVLTILQKFSTTTNVVENDAETICRILENEIS